MRSRRTFCLPTTNFRSHILPSSSRHTAPGHYPAAHSGRVHLSSSCATPPPHTAPLSILTCCYLTVSPTVPDCRCLASLGIPNSSALSQGKLLSVWFARWLSACLSLLTSLHCNSFFVYGMDCELLRSRHLFISQWTFMATGGTSNLFGSPTTSQQIEHVLTHRGP